MGALKEFSKVNDTIILLVDKGSTIVVLNIGDYHHKSQEIFDPNTYKKMPRDPTTVVKKMGEMLKRHHWHWKFKSLSGRIRPCH